MNVSESVELVKKISSKNSFGRPKYGFFEKGELSGTYSFKTPHQKPYQIGERSLKVNAQYLDETDQNELKRHQKAEKTIPDRL